MTAARQRLMVVVALILLGATGVLAATRTFSTVALAGADQTIAVAGSQAAPALAPLALAQLALAGALTIAGRVARVVLGVVLVVLAAAVVGLVVPIVLDPASGTRGAVTAATGLVGEAQPPGSIAGTGWPLVAVAAALLSAAIGVFVVVRSGRWSTGGRRFRRPADAAVRSTDPIAEWDALTRGGDPTGAPDGDGRAP